MTWSVKIYFNYITVKVTKKKSFLLSVKKKYNHFLLTVHSVEVLSLDKFKHFLYFVLSFSPSCRHRCERLLQELPHDRLHPPPVSAHFPANQLPPQGQALPPTTWHPRASGHHHQRLPNPKAKDLPDQHPPAHFQLSLQSVGPEQEPHPAPDGHSHEHRGAAAAPPHPAAAAPPATAPAEQPAPGLLQQEAVQHRDTARALLTAAGLQPLATHAPQTQGTGHQQQDGGDGVNNEHKIRRIKEKTITGLKGNVPLSSMSTTMMLCKQISHTDFF